MVSKFVSVIVPVYNAEKYLSKCIKSILNQTYRNFELLLVNDGSNDRSGMICQEFQNLDARIKVIDKENKGVSSARNAGLRMCSGDYVTFVDADDYVKETYLERMVEDIIETDADIVVCGNYYENKNHLLIEEKNGRARCIFPEQNQLNFCRDKFMYCVWGKLFRRRILINQWFDEMISIGEDALFIANVTKAAKKIYFNRECLYIYVLNDTSICHRLNPQKREEEIRAWLNICRLLKEGTISYQTAEMQLLKTYRRIQAANWIEGEHDYKKLSLCRMEIKKRWKTVFLVDESLLQKLVLLFFWACPQVYFKIYQKKNKNMNIMREK